jgi:hypothetical protein
MPAAPTCTLLVSSCDRYADLWRPYFSLVEARWPDCPFPIALVTEEKDAGLAGVRSLRLGAGMDWSTLILRALDAVATPWILFTLEDFFLRGPTDSARISRLFETAQRHQLNMLRLIPRPGPTTRLAGNDEFGMIAVGAPFRVSTQAAFWRVDTLRSLIVPGESIWQFELHGSERSRHLDDFAAVWQPAIPYRHHVIERGKWFPWDAWQFRRLDVGVDLGARPMMSTAETLRWMIGKWANPVVRRMPPPMRRALKPVAKRLGWMK